MNSSSWEQRYRGPKLRTVVVKSSGVDGRVRPTAAWSLHSKWVGGGGLVSDSYNIMDCSPPGSSVHGISQARVLEWVTISCSKGSSRPKVQTQVSCLPGRFFTAESAGRLLSEVCRSCLWKQPLLLGVWYRCCLWVALVNSEASRDQEVRKWRRNRPEQVVVCPS